MAIYNAVLCTLMAISCLLSAHRTWAMLPLNAVDIIQPPSSSPEEVQTQVDGAFIIKLRSSTNVTAYMEEIKKNKGLGLSIQHIYNYASPSAVRELQRNSQVEYVEPQRILRVAGEQANPPNWGLSRISQTNLNLDGAYTYPDGSGAGIDAWIIDTGGRARLAANYVKDEDMLDLHGHGTHVAGIIASKTYGVAKRANIIGVKVLNEMGSGSDANVIAGIQHAVKSARLGKSVFNLSLAGTKSRSLDDAVNAAANFGFPVMVAAGNGRQNACNASPSGAKQVFTVAASNKRNQQAQFTNYGGWINTASGTSMAVAHVTGVAALYLAKRSYNKVDDFYDELITRATTGKLTRLSPGSANRIISTRGA
ncbi:peptidase S8/S53 domain-containing protein [Syncephalis plumigaleata]|nr:peptidase S8/S53 domain-containing protein [Syncephalis plumigaleata]